VKNLPTFEEFSINEEKHTYYPMYHGGVMDFSKPIYFSDSELIASTYGKVSGPYKIILEKLVVIDFSSAEGWWLPEKSAKKEVKKFGMELEDFDKYKEHNNIRSIKTDHFVQAAKDKNFDGVVFENIMDAGSLPVKADKYIRTTNIAVINTKYTIIK